jgi:hypothetical protein
MAIHAWTLILKIKISTPIGFIAAQKSWITSKNNDES